MEPQLFSCGLLNVCKISNCSAFNLQWSRNFSVADWYKFLTAAPPNNTFNGAATFQLRIDVPTKFNPIPRYPFNGAATFQLRIVDNIDVYNAVVGTFNGAATFQLRIENWIQRRPSSFTPFNGAATFQLRIVATAAAALHTAATFNGAATFQLRIESDASTCVIDFNCLQWSRNFSVADWELSLTMTVVNFLLQWSRNFSVADCWLENGAPMHYTQPSMEPQLFSCGLLNANTSPQLRQSTFNGAATFQLRIGGMMCHVW